MTPPNAGTIRPRLAALATLAVVIGTCASLARAQTALDLGGTNAYVDFESAGTRPALGLATFTIETWFNRQGSGVATSTGTGGIASFVPLLTKGASQNDGSNVDANYVLGIDNAGSVIAADFEQRFQACSGGSGGCTTAPFGPGCACSANANCSSNVCAAAGLNHPLSGATPIQNGVWYHAAATYDGAAWRLYLNGVLEAELLVGAQPRADSIQHAALGTTLTSSGTPSGFFDGLLDEARVWSAARTAASIRALMNVENPSGASAAGLVARWGLNEGAGTAVADSIGTANGAIFGTSFGWSGPPGAPFDVAPCTDATNAVLRFDGVNDYVSLGNAAELGLTTFTVETWFEREGAGTGVGTGSAGIAQLVPLVAKGSAESDGTGCPTGDGRCDANYVLGIRDLRTCAGGSNAGAACNVASQCPSGSCVSPGAVLAADFEQIGRCTGGTNAGANCTLATTCSGGGTCTNQGLNHPIAGTTVISDHRWYHAAVTYDGATLRLYLNGVLEGSVATGGVVPRFDSLQPAALAAMVRTTGTANGFYNGLLDETRIWNVARTAAEIQAGMIGTLTAGSGLVARWGMSEGGGTSIADAAAPATTGTLVNGPTWTFSNALFAASGACDDGSACNGADSCDPATLRCSVHAGVCPTTAPTPTTAATPTSTRTATRTTTPLATGPSPTPTRTATRTPTPTRTPTRTATPTPSRTTTPTPVPTSQLALVAPPNGAGDVARAPTLDVTVTTGTGVPATVTFFGRRVPPPDFTLVALPDTQFYTSSMNGGTPEILWTQTQWIVDQRAARNIVFVTQLGDCTQHGDNGSPSGQCTSPQNVEWVNADTGFAKIENPAATGLPHGIPYGIAVGNHDQSPIANPDGTTACFNQFFGVSRFAGRGYYGGHFPATSNDNHYELFSASGMDFIVIHFEYDTTPDAAVLAWANTVLQANPDRRAIIVSHYILDPGADAPGNVSTFGAQGQAIYDNLKGNPNLFLMLSGHVTPPEGRRQDTFNGKTVHSLLSDYQGRAHGGDGWLRIMRFSPRDDTIYVQTYSPTLGQFETDDSSQFTVPYGMGGAFEIVATRTDVPSGGHATAPWPGLAPATGYEWYAVVTDGTSTLTGPTWTFTTLADGSTPTVTRTPTPTLSPTATRTATVTRTATPTRTATRSPTPTLAGSRTPTPTASGARTPTRTMTATPTVSTTATPDAGVLDLPAAADTYIEAGAQARWDHGISDHLEVDLSPLGFTYFTFDLSAVAAPIQRATLTLWCTNPSADGGTFYPVGSSGWIEGDRTGTTSASLDGPGLKWVDVDTNGDGAVDALDVSPFVPAFGAPLATVGAVTTNSAVTVDLTAAFQGGAGVYSLALRNGSTDGATFASAEAPTASQRPRLRLELAPPAAALADTSGSARAPTCPAAVVEADVLVSAVRPSTHFGARRRIGASRSQRTFFRVMVSGLGDRRPSAVHLHVTVDDRPGAASIAGGELAWIGDCTWDELAATWSRQPDTTDAVVLDVAGPVRRGATVDFDVTTAVGGDGTYCFVLDGTSDDEVAYRSSEARSGRPDVEIRFDGQCDPPE